MKNDVVDSHDNPAYFTSASSPDPCSDEDCPNSHNCDAGDGAADGHHMAYTASINSPTFLEEATASAKETVRKTCEALELLLSDCSGESNTSSAEQDDRRLNHALCLWNDLATASQHLATAIVCTVERESGHAETPEIFLGENQKGLEKDHGWCPNHSPPPPMSTSSLLRSYGQLRTSIELAHTEIHSMATDED